MCRKDDGDKKENRKFKYKIYSNGLEVAKLFFFSFFFLFAFWVPQFYYYYFKYYYAHFLYFNVFAI